jgi:hypothetical protein
MTRVGRLGTVVVLLAALAGCGAQQHRPTTGELMSRYFRSTHVRHDLYAGATSADRLAQFAAEGGPEAIVASMFSVYECIDADYLEQQREEERYRTYAGACPTADAQRRAERFAGRDGTVYTRRILIRHRDGSLDLGTVYVPQRRHGGTELVDANGGEYRSLDDFRQHNTTLHADDWIVTLQQITSIPGHGRIVTVTGHTAPDRRPWLYAGLALALLVLAGAAVLVVRAVRRRRTPDPLLERWSA